MSFTIGADPELICHRNGQFVPAHNFFKSNSIIWTRWLRKSQQKSVQVFLNLLSI